MPRSISVDGPLPYPFKTRPYQHQLVCWEASKDKPAYALLYAMGAGKSKSLIDTAAYLYDTDKINALVVTAPKSVYLNWFDSELPAHMPAHVRYKVGIWSAEGRKCDLDSLDALMRPSDSDLHVLLINIEALGRDLENNRAFAFLQKFLCAHRAMLAVDESTTIKNPQATRTKALMKLRNYAPYRRILSGQPAVNGPLDMYSQCAFLDPRLLGYSSYYAYKAHFAQLVPMRVHISGGTRTIQKVTGYQNLDELQRTLSKFSFIVKKEDCLDLPQKLPRVLRRVEMGPKQRKAYNDMARLSIVEIEKSIQNPSHKAPTIDDFRLISQAQTIEAAPPPETSTASLVITQMLRLHQILCGFIVTDDRKPVLFDEPNPRLDDLMECVGEASGKVVIWATYKISIRQIAERLAKEYGPETVATYYGETSTDDRRAAIRDFQSPDSPVRFFVLNRTGSRGLTLTAAHTAVYYSYDHDLDTHDQSQDRIHRIGQHWPCSYIYQTVPGTVEDKILLSLQTKQQLSKMITPSNWKTFLQAEDERTRLPKAA